MAEMTLYQRVSRFRDRCEFRYAQVLDKLEAMEEASGSTPIREYKHAQLLERLVKIANDDCFEIVSFNARAETDAVGVDGVEQYFQYDYVDFLNYQDGRFKVELLTDNEHSNVIMSERAFLAYINHRRGVNG